nr:hypothetical protein HK105_002997 [Polyrhizophydium stewartii]
MLDAENAKLSRGPQAELLELLSRKEGERALGISTVRYLPKEVGARPIMNLKRVPGIDEFERLGMTPKQLEAIPRERFRSRTPLSINQILKNAFHVLMYEKSVRPSLVAGSALGVNDIYASFKMFKRRLMEGQPAGRIPKLYVCKVDVAACFDTINQSKLLELLEEILRDLDYVVQKFATVRESGGQIRRQYHRRACTEADPQAFVQVAEQLSATVGSTIFVDQVVYSIETARMIRDTILSHIKNNIVKVGKRFYRQRVGVPQGSVLSTLLCSMFYSKLESVELKDIVGDDPHTILLRYVDDFLMMTTSKERAVRFVERMHQGFPEYGCAISPSKTLVNFDVRIDGTLLPRCGSEIAWCGSIIDIQRLQVKAVHALVGGGSSIADKLSIDISRNRGRQLRSKMLYFIKFKNHALYTDMDINSRSTVLFNIYQTFASAALRFSIHVLEGLHGRIGQNVQFLSGAVIGIAAFLDVFAQSGEQFSVLAAPLREAHDAIRLKDWQLLMHERIRCQARKAIADVVRSWR